MFFSDAGSSPDFSLRMYWSPSEVPYNQHSSGSVKMEPELRTVYNCCIILYYLNNSIPSHLPGSFYCLHFAMPYLTTQVFLLKILNCGTYNNLFLEGTFVLA